MAEWYDNALAGMVSDMLISFTVFLRRARTFFCFCFWHGRRPSMPKGETPPTLRSAPP